MNSEPEETIWDRIEKGRQLRDEGMAKVEAAELPWSQQAARWIEAQPAGRDFTADMLTHDIGQPEHRNAVGPAFAAAARRKWIQRVGLAQSSIPTSHASVIQIWRRL